MTYPNLDAVKTELLARVSVGETLRRICQDSHMPHFETAYQWMRSDQAFALQYQQARESGFEALAQECLAIADEAIESSEQLGRNKLRVHTRLALLGKWSPRYSDRQQVLWFHVSELSFYCNQPGNWNMSTATPRTRRSFTAEQKVHAIRLVREQHLSVNAVCQDLNVAPSTVHRWLQQHDGALSTAPARMDVLSAEQRRIRELEKENNQLKQDVAIIKKASAFFAQALR